MLQLFSRLYSNIAIIIIFICLVSLQLAAGIQELDEQIWLHSAPLSMFIYKLIGLNTLNNYYIHFILSFSLVALQLFLVFNIIYRIKNLEKFSYLATWFYLWMLHLFPEWSSFSPASIALTLILVILYLLFSEAENNSNDHIFNISLLVGISFLIWYPSIMLLGFLGLALFQYNALNLKRVAIIFLSFSVPLIAYIFYYLIIDKGMEIIYQFSNFHLYSIQGYKFQAVQALPMLFLSIILIIGGTQALIYASKTAKISRLFVNSIFTLLIILVFGFFLSINAFHYSILQVILPFTLFLVFFINIIKRPIFAEILHLAIIMAILFNFVYSLQQLS